jgi:hypothetical protein
MANSTEALEGSPPPKKSRLLPSTTTALNAALAASTLLNPPKPIEIHRSDYRPLRYIITHVSLDFGLFDGYTIVESVYTVGLNPNYDITTDSSNDGDEGLILNGDETCVKLLSLSRDDVELSPKEYELTPGKLVIFNIGEGSVVKMRVEIVPEENTQLSGLYKSGGMFCSQCEAEGFRRSELVYMFTRFTKHYIINVIHPLKCYFVLFPSAKSHILSG